MQQAPESKPILYRSKWAILLSMAILLFTTFNLSRWNNHSVVIHDIQSYYSYLPAVFIYQDLSFDYKFAEGADSIMVANTWALTTPDGKPVQKMSGGLSILYSPFFLLSHAYALLTDYKATGYSVPYQKGLALSSVFYALLGMLLMRKTLLRFFSDQAVALTIFSIYVGTNLFFYIVVEGAMSHNYSVFLISLLAYWVTQNRDTFSFARSFRVGVVMGLLAIVRPINAIVALFPALYWLLNKEDKSSKTVGHWLAVFVGGLVGILPQLLYWKYATGDWIYYSYNDEGFFFSDPALVKGLFSFRKGWFIYTPLMFLGFFGFVSLLKKQMKLALPIAAVVIVYAFVAFSWWCWWYGGSFGMRAMIDVYALLAFPLAALFHSSLAQKSKCSRWAVLTVVMVLIGWNQLQIFQYRKGVLHYDSMTADAYKAILFSTKYPKNYIDLIESPDYDAAKRGENR